MEQNEIKHWKITNPHPSITPQWHRPSLATRIKQHQSKLQLFNICNQ